MKTVTVSAPGKLLLLGDHAVVYGYPCIVTAVDQRIMVSITETLNAGVVYDVGASDTKFLDAGFKVAQSLWGNISHIAVQTKSQFSSQLGLGSSAAVTVSFLFALSKYLHKPLKSIDLFNAAYKAVLAVQGVGSGFDVAVAIYGGTIRYVMGGKEITPLDAHALSLVVGYTGVKADTTTIVKDVKKKYEENKEKVTRIFEAIGKLVDQATVRFTEGDWERVGKFMDFNQEYLRDLGVSSEKLEALIVAAKNAGALGAKLSGAGGGDCMIALVTNDTKKSVEVAIENAGGQVIHLLPNAQGIRVETDNQQELFVVVDKNDTIIEFRTRYECHHDPSLIHRSIGVLIFDSKDRILLQKRSQNKDTYPGYWGLSCAGHVAKGETYEQTVMRELQEELGASMQVTFHSKRIDRELRETEMEVLFTAKYDGPFHINPDEIDEVKFFDKRELALGIASHKLKLTKAALDNLKTIGVLS